MAKKFGHSRMPPYWQIMRSQIRLGERGGLVVNASDSGSRGRDSSPSRVKPCCVLEQGTFTPQKVLVIPRKQWLRPNMTEKLFSGTLRINQPTNIRSDCSFRSRLIWVYTAFWPVCPNIRENITFLLAVYVNGSVQIC